jgi:hypothetical protein
MAAKISRQGLNGQSLAKKVNNCQKNRVFLQKLPHIGYC